MNVLVLEANELEPMSRRLRRLRLDRGLSLKDVGVAIGVPVSTYKEWEYGRAIQGEPYTRLAQCFGVTTNELLTGDRPGDTLLAIRDEMTEIQKRIAALEQKLLSLF